MRERGELESGFKGQEEPPEGQHLASESDSSDSSSTLWMRSCMRALDGVNLGDEDRGTALGSLRPLGFRQGK